MSLFHCAEHGIYGPEGVCPKCGKPGAIVTGSLTPCGSVTFDVIPTTDTELTCVACLARNPTHEFRVRDYRGTSWIGIHERCFDTFRRRNSDVKLQEPPGQVSQPASSCGLPGDSCGSTYEAAMRLERRAELAYEAFRAKLREMGFSGDHQEWEYALTYDREAWRAAVLALDEGASE